MPAMNEPMLVTATLSKQMAMPTPQASKMSPRSISRMLTSLSNLCCEILASMAVCVFTQDCARLTLGSLGRANSQLHRQPVGLGRSLRLLNLTKLIAIHGQAQRVLVCASCLEVGDKFLYGHLSPTMIDGGIGRA